MYPLAKKKYILSIVLCSLMGISAPTITYAADNFDVLLDIERKASVDTFVKKENSMVEYINTYIKETGDANVTLAKIDTRLGTDPATAWLKYAKNGNVVLTLVDNRTLQLDNTLGVDNATILEYYRSSSERDPTSLVTGSGAAVGMTIPLSEEAQRVIEVKEEADSNPDIEFHEEGTTADDLPAADDGKMHYISNGDGTISVYMWDATANGGAGGWVEVGQMGGEGSGGGSGSGGGPDIKFLGDRASLFSATDTPGIEGMMAWVEEDDAVSEYIYNGTRWLLKSGGAGTSGGPQVFTGASDVCNFFSDLFDSMGGSSATIPKSNFNDGAGDYVFDIVQDTRLADGKGYWKAQGEDRYALASLVDLFDADFTGKIGTFYVDTRDSACGFYKFTRSNPAHPYTLTGVSNGLDFSSWNGVDIAQVMQDGTMHNLHTDIATYTFNGVVANITIKDAGNTATFTELAVTSGKMMLQRQSGSVSVPRFIGDDVLDLLDAAIVPVEGDYGYIGTGAIRMLYESGNWIYTATDYEDLMAAAYLGITSDAEADTGFAVKTNGYYFKRIDYDAGNRHLWVSMAPNLGNIYVSDVLENLPDGAEENLYAGGFSPTDGKVAYLSAAQQVTANTVAGKNHYRAEFETANGQNDWFLDNVQLLSAFTGATPTEDGYMAKAKAAAAGNNLVYKWSLVNSAWKSIDGSTALYAGNRDIATVAGYTPSATLVSFYVTIDDCLDADNQCNGTVDVGTGFESYAGVTSDTLYGYYYTTTGNRKNLLTDAIPYDGSTAGQQWNDVWSNGDAAILWDFDGGATDLPSPVGGADIAPSDVLIKGTLKGNVAYTNTGHYVNQNQALFIPQDVLPTAGSVVCTAMHSQNADITRLGGVNYLHVDDLDCFANGTNLVSAIGYPVLLNGGGLTNKYIKRCNPEDDDMLWSDNCVDFSASTVVITDGSRSDLPSATSGARVNISKIIGPEPNFTTTGIKWGADNTWFQWVYYSGATPENTNNMTDTTEFYAPPEMPEIGGGGGVQPPEIPIL